MSGGDATNQQRTIARLQSIMLASVLRQAPLPGQNQPVGFPDLAYLTESPKVLVLDENVPGQLEVAGIDRPVEVVPETEIREAAAHAGDRVYVRFQPPVETDGQIRIVMEVKIAPTEPDIHPLGLGAISATFVRTPGDDWIVTEPPVSLAY